MFKLKKFKLIYTLISCVFIIGYIAFNGQDAINSVNASMKSALIASGELSEEDLKPKKTADKKDNTQKPKYKMEPLDENLEIYLDANGYKEKTDAGKKLLIYVNVYDLDCPYHAQFRKDIASYKNSPAWANRFTFVENRVSQNSTSTQNFLSMEQVKQHEAFLNYCSILCVVDFENKKMFSYKGKVGDSKYLYDLMSSCYN